MERVDVERIPTADLVEEDEKRNSVCALDIGVNTSLMRIESRNTGQSSLDSNPLNKFQKVPILTLNSMEPIKLQRFSFD